MTVHEYERLVPRDEDLPEKVSVALDPNVAGTRILEVTTGRAHGVTETSVSYLRDEALHQVVYDETTGKVLGGNEPAVIEKVIAVSPESGQRRVREGGERFHQFKIKHDEQDDREYVHVHYVGDDGIFSHKLELDGSDKRKAAV